MKLRAKNLGWLAGRPVVILNGETATKLNVFVGDRVVIKTSRKIYAIVDIFSGLVKENEIGLSQELSKILGTKNKEFIEVDAGELSKATYLINKKIRGEKLSGDEVSYIISEIVNNNLTEAEIAYFNAAEKINGMTMEEVINLTKTMVKTGARLKFNKKYVADKHCIGGIAGNRTTPILVSICACAGLTMPKTSSRAITSASGTADVIEVISNIELPLKKIKEVVDKTGACLAWGGSLGLAPSDDKIIRVERLLNLDVEPQMISSIMSKKISVGSKYIVIDIPFGRESKEKNLKEAKAFGEKFQKVAKYFKLKLKCIYTDGKQPIGNGIGPMLELLDVVAVLKNSPDAPVDLKEKAIFIASEVMKLCGIKNGEQKAKEILSSGKAYEKFLEILAAQSEVKKEEIEKRICSLKSAKFKKIIRSKKSGEISAISNKGINSLCRILGTPETKNAGVYLHKHIGKIKKGETIITLYSENMDKLRDGMKYLNEFKPIEIR